MHSTRVLRQPASGREPPLRGPPRARADTRRAALGPILWQAARVSSASAACDPRRRGCTRRRLWRPGLSLAFATGLALFGTSLRAVADDPSARWPRWPGEVATIVAPLYDANATEGAQIRALAELSGFRTAVIETHVLYALGRPSNALQSRALTMCSSRRIRRCAEPAIAQMRSDPTLAALAANVVALDPTGPRLEALFEAMALGSDSVRVASIRALGGAPLSDLDRDRVRERLIAKLNDISAEVRAAAATSLGLLRAREASPALARALEDPDPSVVEAAAQGLADLEDARALPALVRIAERSIDANLVKLALRSIARLPGQAADAQLLAWLEARPPRISLDQLVGAIGLRDPSPALVEELVMRLRIPSLRGPAESILRLMGPGAAPHVRAQWRDDDDRSTQSTLADLLASWSSEENDAGAAAEFAHDPATQRRSLHAVPGSVEQQDDARATRDQIAIVRMWSEPEIATALAQRWLAPNSNSAASIESALVALASRDVGDAPLGSRSEQRWRVATLRAVALDPQRPIEARCLATQALGAEVERPAEQTLIELRSASSAALRACSIAVLLRRSIAAKSAHARNRRAVRALIRSALADPSERVRLSVCLAMIEATLADAGSVRLGDMVRAVQRDASHDSRDSVRQAALVLATLHGGLPEDGTTARTRPRSTGRNHAATLGRDHGHVRGPGPRTISDPMPGSNLVSRPGFVLLESPHGASLEVPVWGARRWSLVRLPADWRPVYRSIPPVQDPLGPWNFD